MYPHVEVKDAAQPANQRNALDPDENLQPYGTIPRRVIYQIPDFMRTNWLPPRDSNPDMLIQSQLSCH